MYFVISQAINNEINRVFTFDVLSLLNKIYLVLFLIIKQISSDRWIFWHQFREK